MVFLKSRTLGIVLKQLPTTRQGVRHGFVCAACRHKLFSSLRTPTRSRQLTTTWFVAARRTYSAHTPWVERGANRSGQISKFVRPDVRAWSVRASAYAQNRRDSSLTNLLLPHELSARQKAGVTRPSPGKAEIIEPKKKQVYLSDIQSVRSNDSAKLDLSRSVFADVFTTNREPRRPPVPSSWSSKKRQTSVEGTDDRSKQALHDTSSRFPNTQNLSKTTDSLSGGPSILPKSSSESHGSASIENANPDKFKPRLLENATSLSQVSRLETFQGNSSSSRGNKISNSKGTTKPPNFWQELDSRVAEYSSRNQIPSAVRDPLRMATSADQTQPTNQEHSPTTSESELKQSNRRSRFENGEDKQSGMKGSAGSRQNFKKSHRERFQAEAEADYRWDQRQRRQLDKEARKQSVMETKQAPVPILLPEFINVANFARSLKQNATKFLKDMEEMGFENVTLDTILTGETASLIAMEYNFEPSVDTDSQKDIRPRSTPEDVSSLPQRPPVVTIMGHVDHGKTTLLDWLRRSSVAAQEHGGITQHIGAFRVKMSSGKSITFLDTPGHAAFLSMRQRGANVTDIVVLVVAADDGVKPQTIEALKHAKAAKAPIIVTINKVDKEDARIEQVKADLSRIGVEIEDYGGEVQVVGVSGKTGQGMSDLEESILTLSEVLDVRAERDGMAEGWVLESSVKVNGKMATVLVRRGTLRTGDFIVAGKTWARIRAMRDDLGAEISEASPGVPAEILGWRDLPEAGAMVLQAEDENRAKTAVEYRLEMAEREASSAQIAEQEQRQREREAAEAAKRAADDRGGDRPLSTSEETSVRFQSFIVKADVVGSAEAVCGSLLELGNAEVRAKILRSSAGQISEQDVDHAAASKSVIVNFNNPILPQIRRRAEQAKVKILDHSIIYHVVDDARVTLSDLLPVKISFRVTGEADVLQIFSINVRKRVYQNIAGCRVRNGAIKKSSKVRVLRMGEIVFEGNIGTLKHVKKDIMEAGKGSECGIGLEGFQDLAVDDQIQAFEEIREARTL